MGRPPLSFLSLIASEASILSNLAMCRSFGNQVLATAATACRARAQGECPTFVGRRVGGDQRDGARRAGAAPSGQRDGTTGDARTCTARNDYSTTLTFGRR